MKNDADVIIHDTLTRYAEKFTDPVAVLSVTDPRELAAYIMVYVDANTGETTVTHLPRGIANAERVIARTFEGPVR